MSRVRIRNMAPLHSVLNFKVKDGAMRNTALPVTVPPFQESLCNTD